MKNMIKTRKLISQLIWLLVKDKKTGPKLVLFKEEQRPDPIDAASHVGAAVLAHLARNS